MYKYKVKIGAILTLAILSVFFYACKTSDTSVTKHTVTIDLNGGTGLSSTTYTVNDGDTLNITETPTNTAAYSVLKDYRNTADNSVFIMGQTKVNADITLKVEWEFSLTVIRDLLTADGGKWVNDSYILTFRKSNESSLAINYDTDSTLGSALDLFNAIVNLTASDNNAHIAKFSTKLGKGNIEYVDSVDANTLKLYDATQILVSTYTKLAQ